MTLEKHALGYFVRVENYADTMKYRSLFSFFGLVFGSDKIVGVAINEKFSKMPIENIIKEMKDIIKSFK